MCRLDSDLKLYTILKETKQKALAEASYSKNSDCYIHEYKQHTHVPQFNSSSHLTSTLSINLFKTDFGISVL